jgi:rhodanese-related sulfurtransferase
MAKRISPREAQELLAQGYTYVDVRSTAEFEAGHPAGAVLVPLAERGPAGMQPNPAFVDDVAARFAKDAKLVLGCEAGGRSARAAAMLEQAGFTHVFDQRAGFGGARDPSGRVVEKGWRDEGLAVEQGRG